MEQLVGDVFLAMELSLQYVLARKDMLRDAMWKVLLNLTRSGVCDVDTDGATRVSAKYR